MGSFGAHEEQEPKAPHRVAHRGAFPFSAASCWAPRLLSFLRSGSWASWAAAGGGALVREGRGASEGNAGAWGSARTSLGPERARVALGRAPWAGAARTPSASLQCPLPAASRRRLGGRLRRPVLASGEAGAAGLRRNPGIRGVRGEARGSGWQVLALAKTLGFPGSFHSLTSRLLLCEMLTTAADLSHLGSRPGEGQTMLKPSSTPGPPAEKSCRG